MANNCLVTTLKATVDNPNLSKLGYLKVDVKRKNNPSSFSQKLILRGTIGNSYGYGTREFNCTIVGDGYFTNTYGGESIGKEVTLSASKKTVYCSNGNYTLLIDNKYSINTINGVILCNNSDYFSDYNTFVGDNYDLSSIDSITNSYKLKFVQSCILFYNGDTQNPNLLVELLSTDTNLITFKCAKINVSADLDIFADISRPVTEITLWPTTRANVVGNISSLGKCRSLQFLNLDYTSCTGSIEELAAAQVEGANPRTSGTLTVSLVGNETITYNGSVFNGTKTITFNSSQPNGYSIS